MMENSTVAGWRRLAGWACWCMESRCLSRELARACLCCRWLCRANAEARCCNFVANGRIGCALGAACADVLCRPDVEETPNPGLPRASTMRSGIDRRRGLGLGGNPMHVFSGRTKSRTGAERDAPGRWLASTPLLDLEDPRLAIRATSLTQLASSDRAKALAIYGFVKRMPYRRPFKMSHRRAREVLDSGWGDGPDKATLMVALLRSVGVPARLRMVRMDGRIMRGLVDRLDAISWPFVEVWLDDRWIRTDTYIFDAG